MTRFYSVQDGHHVPLIPPQNITGGITSPAFAVKNYAHSSIFLNLGAQAAACTAILLLAAANAAGTGPTFTGTTASGSNQVTGVFPFNGINAAVGQGISGTGIPGSTTVTAVGAPNSLGLVTVYLSANATAAGTVTLTMAAMPIAYDLFACEVANQDTLGPRLAQTAAGYAPSATADIFYVIEYETSQLPPGYDYLALKVANGANANYAAAHAVLSGARFGQDQSPSVLV